MQKEHFDFGLINILSQFPPATINNSRSIVRNKIAKFDEYPSDSRAHQLEAMTGVSPDHSDRDFESEPETTQSETPRK